MEKFYIPYAVEYSSRGKYPDVDVGHNDIVEMTKFLVLEESVWHPNPASLRHGQILQLSCGL